MEPHEAIIVASCSVALILVLFGVFMVMLYLKEREIKSILEMAAAMINNETKN